MSLMNWVNFNRDETGAPVSFVVYVRDREYIFWRGCEFVYMRDSSWDVCWDEYTVTLVDADLCAMLNGVRDRLLNQHPEERHGTVIGCAPAEQLIDRLRDVSPLFDRCVEAAAKNREVPV